MSDRVRLHDVDGLPEEITIEIVGPCPIKDGTIVEVARLGVTGVASNVRVHGDACTFTLTPRKGTTDGKNRHD